MYNRAHRRIIYASASLKDTILINKLINVFLQQQQQQIDALINASLGRDRFCHEESTHQVICTQGSAAVFRTTSNGTQICVNQQSVSLSDCLLVLFPAAGDWVFNSGTYESPICIPIFLYFNFIFHYSSMCTHI